MNIARLKNTKAFTLIELIVVIVILGILVAIGAFAYQSLISSSRVSAAEKTAQQVAKTVAADKAAYTGTAPIPAPAVGNILSAEAIPPGQAAAVTGATNTVFKLYHDDAKACSTVTFAGATSPKYSVDTVKVAGSANCT